MRLLRAADHRRMPWKNGGGETAEIVCVPEGAGLDAFRWRASMARVERSGPFSLFASVDRTLAVLSGDGLELDVEGMDSVTLHPSSPPFRFLADRQTECRLVGGPVTDLNIMTRRGAAKHAMRRAVLDEGKSASLDDATLLVVGSGAGNMGNVRLGPGDAVLAEGEALLFQAEEASVVFVIAVSV